MIPNVDFINRFEAGEAEDEEIIEEFQKMINSGVVWVLQGFYSRMAQAMIEDGVCSYCGPVPEEEEA